MLVKLIQNYVRNHVMTEFYDNAHALAVAFVPQVCNAVDDLVLDKLSDIFNKPGLVHLVGKLCHNDAVLVFLHRLDMSPRPDFDNAASGRVSAYNSFIA